MALQMAYFDRIREPVVTDIGPVLDLEDVVGGKVCALASRAYERDYLDTAAALERYSPAELIGFARRLDPGLEARDFAEAGQQRAGPGMPRRSRPPQSQAARTQEGGCSCLERLSPCPATTLSGRQDHKERAQCRLMCCQARSIGSVTLWQPND
jgi:hypothetical protein